MKHAPFDVKKGVANVVAHVPARFDPRQQVHLVLFFHGAVQCAVQLASLGEITCEPGGKTLGGYGYNRLHDDAGKNTLFAIPQFALFGGGSAGHMIDKGFFTGFVQELGEDVFAKGLGAPKSLDDVADITLIGHSAGFNPILAILARGELADKVRNVVLLDSLFAGGEAFYAAWLKKDAGGPKKKLVAIHGDSGDTNGHHASLAKMIPKDESLALYPKGSVVEAIRDHDVTIAALPVNHYWTPSMLLSKVVAGLDLPDREAPIARFVDAYADAPLLPFDVDVKGAIDDADALLDDGASADEFRLPLASGDHATITVKGGPSITETCCTLDVVAQLFDGDRLVAQDDDGDGTFDSRLAFIADHAATYRLRVRTAGAGPRRGPYVVKVTK